MLLPSSTKCTIVVLRVRVNKAPASVLFVHAHTGATTNRSGRWWSWSGDIHGADITFVMFHFWTKQGVWFSWFHLHDSSFHFIKQQIPLVFLCFSTLHQTVPTIHLFGNLFRTHVQQQMFSVVLSGGVPVFNCSGQFIVFNFTRPISVHDFQRQFKFLVGQSNANKF